ncbi:MAG: hypothetical protein ACRDZO_15115 [Egibacteraceae bacterium]
MPQNRREDILTTSVPPSERQSGQTVEVSVQPARGGDEAGRISAMTDAATRLWERADALRNRGYHTDAQRCENRALGIMERLGSTPENDRTPERENNRAAGMAM